ATCASASYRTSTPSSSTGPPSRPRGLRARSAMSTSSRSSVIRTSASSRTTTPSRSMALSWSSPSRPAAAELSIHQPASSVVYAPPTEGAVLRTILLVVLKGNTAGYRTAPASYSIRTPRSKYQRRSSVDGALTIPHFHRCVGGYRAHDLLDH